MKNLMPLSDGKLMVKNYLDNKSKVICAIFVGVDSNGNEITIKNNGFIANTGVNEEYVIELSSKCPPSCSDENDQSIKKLIWI
jgi:hypothetical protein